MRERAELAQARQKLARVEANLLGRGALSELDEALALIDDVLLDGGDDERAVALNLGCTYGARIVASIAKSVEADPALPEPELELYFKLLLTFDDSPLEPPLAASNLKLTIARRLIDRYLEGHPAAIKENALHQLLQIAGRD